jgi:hypothetical protein
VAGQSSRKRRADAGEHRLSAALAGALTGMLQGQERPRQRDLEREVAAFCRRRRLRCPARATLYRFMNHAPPHMHRIEDLPPEVRQALYNLDPTGEVPGHQLAFYAFHHGDTRAMSFAAGLPWLDLHQAARMRGWRPRSHGLLRAVMRRRGI